MRSIILSAAVFALFAPGLAAAAIPCSDLPKAQSFVDGLKPGPNTRAAQSHLDAAKTAASPEQCSAELQKVDYYARRSAAADRRAARHRVAYHRHVLCADALHQDRPGGSDYHGRPVPGCPRVP